MKNKEESNGTVIAFAETGTAVAVTYVEIMNLFILLESSLTS
ncbi:putative membrane protein [Clostridioides difficile DA00165]|nr:putative membrane protein [Clostridioides difficile DA00165]